ncbi:hypothetical protein CEXT_388781 [Caerostris extrusa]|uniref:Uncharacterized protein n=1 Tax=Caerostris extrusa TaxID=172846 RepID=A0AAV4YDX0_CAEEX|nr:hypothetical protein CEXT_388781 [Caerostris extrusa]
MAHAPNSLIICSQNSPLEELGGQGHRSGHHHAHPSDIVLRFWPHQSPMKISWKYNVLNRSIHSIFTSCTQLKNMQQVSFVHTREASDPHQKPNLSQKYCICLSRCVVTKTKSKPSLPKLGISACKCCY